MNSDLLTKIQESVLPLVKSLNLVLYDVEFDKEGKDYFLRIILEDENGFMDLDTCAKASELISKKLDDLDLIEHEYFLEVCSPGAEKPIKNIDQMENAIGNHIYVELKEEVKGKMTFTGDLLSFSDNVLTIEYRDKAVSRKVEISYENIKKARLAVKF